MTITARGVGRGEERLQPLDVPLRDTIQLVLLEGGLVRLQRLRESVEFGQRSGWPYDLN